MTVRFWGQAARIAVMACSNRSTTRSVFGVMRRGGHRGRRHQVERRRPLHAGPAGTSSRWAGVVGDADQHRRTRWATPGAGIDLPGADLEVEQRSAVVVEG